MPKCLKYSGSLHAERAGTQNALQLSGRVSGGGTGRGAGRCGAGRRPDVLDVVVRGTPHHYFETDREPWASTGFGALEPDLVTRLHRDLR